MNFLKKQFTNLIILLVFAIGIFLRGTWYGDLRLSTANAETDSYINSSRAPIFSWGMFAGQRLFTTNLIFKVANDPANCPIISYSLPGLGEEGKREVQPCFDKIALLQNYLSIFGWCFLGWMVASKLSNPLIRIFSATAIMLFGFTPQIAEWDSLLSPESLSLSLFAITLGIALELIFRVTKSEIPFKTSAEKLLLALLITVFLLWVFVRDVHLYAIPITIILLTPLLLIKKFKATRALPVTLAILLITFLVGYASARDSLRATRFPLMNSLDEYILPHPARVEFFQKFGMPEKEAESYFDAPNYQAWADENAAKAYAIFLVTHPGFVITTLWENMDLLTGEYGQPYFITDEVKNRNFLLTLGEMVNPDSGVVYLLSLVILIVYFFQAMGKQYTAKLSAWAWLAICAYGIAAATLFISYFGDTAGLRRHIMPSVEMFRLFLWVFLLPFFDMAFNKTSE